MKYGDYIKGNGKNEDVRILPDGTVVNIANGGAYATGMSGGAGSATPPPPSTVVAPTVGVNAPTVTPSGQQGAVVNGAAPSFGGGNGIVPNTNAVTPPSAPAGGTTGGNVGGNVEGGNVSGESTTTPDYTTYSGYLDAINKQHESGVGMAAQIRDGLLKLSASERDRIYADAEAARKRAVIDAGTARKAASTTYGKQAEALARAGMSGSGYGEYLEGRNYATERGEIVAANQGEAAAKREADYNYMRGMAEANNTYAQMKGAADSTYYQNLIGYEQKADADKKAEEDKGADTYMKLLEIAKSGDYTEEEIRNLAARLGMDETDAVEISNAAKNAAEKTPEKSDNAAAYAELLGMVKSGGYTSSEIRDLAGKAGLSTEEIASLEKYGKEADDKAQQAAFDEQLAYMTGAETNASIEGTDYTPEQKKKLYDNRDRMQLSVIPTAVANNGAQATFDAIDSAMENDLLTEDGYREGYFLTFLEMIDGDGDLYGNAGTIETQIQKAETQGKLTATDAAALKKYVQNKIVVSLDKDYGHLTKRGDLAGLFWLSVPGNEQANKAAVTTRVESGTKELSYLNQIEPTVGQIAKIGDNYYAYVQYDGYSAPQWYHFKQGGTKKKFDELFNNLSAKSGKVNRPKHSED